jgi:hypothetical protein
MLNATQGVVDRLGDMQAAETRVAKENLKGPCYIPAVSNARSNLLDVTALLVARDAAKLAATRPSTIPTPEQRAETMEEYQQKRAAAMKASRMGDALLAKYQDHLRRLREEEIELEHSDVADEHVMDGTMCVFPLAFRSQRSPKHSHSLKLEVAKQLGFEPIIDSDGNIVKLLIREYSAAFSCLLSHSLQGL